ncbi:MAG: phosphatase PAP2 family protein [Bdellovibrionales bacterium]|nr:phosphatase PAP2 family protein [Bdellovibrionales bacterium]
MKSNILILLLACTLASTPTSVQANTTETLEEIGDVLQFALPGAGLGAAAFFDVNREEALTEWTLSTATGAATQGLMKLVVDKTRPTEDAFSFPSGHTTSAFNGAAFIQRRYGWWWGTPAYGLAGLTAYSRVRAGKHDAIDVTFGAIIGTFTAYVFTTDMDETSSGLNVQPSVGSGYFGLDAVFSGSDEPRPSGFQLPETGTDPTSTFSQLSFAFGMIDQSDTRSRDDRKATGLLGTIRADIAISDDFKVGLRPSVLKNDADPFDSSGLGDTTIGVVYTPYREDLTRWYQLRAWSIALDSMIPTGDEDKGLGSGYWIVSPSIVGSWMPLPNFFVHPTASYYQSLSEPNFDDPDLESGDRKVNFLGLTPRVEYRFNSGQYLFWNPEFLFDLRNGGQVEGNHRLQFGYPMGKDKKVIPYLEYTLVSTGYLNAAVPTDRGPRTYDDLFLVGVRYVF